MQCSATCAGRGVNYITKSSDEKTGLVKKRQARQDPDPCPGVGSSIGEPTVSVERCRRASTSAHGAAWTIASCSHRGRTMANAACGSCDFWQAIELRNPSNGHCRAHPPVAVTTQPLAAWPVTGPTDWCGDYRETDALPSSAARSGPGRSAGG
jgi:hypothetical protein